MYTIEFSVHKSNKKAASAGIKHSGGKKKRKIFIKHLVRIKRFSGGSEDKVSACNAGDLGSIPGLGRSLGERRK